MHHSIDTTPFRITGASPLRLNEHPTRVQKVYEDKADYKDLIGEFQKELNELQRMMYAHDRYSLLLVFQAMDAAGKDGTIRAIMSGVNVHGVDVHAFKRPSAEELDHDFLWRTSVRLPRRGTIGIFNRSYYEEVLVVRVHPSIVTEHQKLPKRRTADLDALWSDRFESIRDFEKHLWHNGTKVLKFFLHLGRDEQRERFLDRIDEPEKNWKFSSADVKERGYWNDYQAAYEEAINATASPDAPWFVIPADSKKNMRLIVAQVILDEMKQLDLAYPQVTDERRAELQAYREELLGD